MLATSLATALTTTNHYRENGSEPRRSPLRLRVACHVLTDDDIDELADMINAAVAECA